MTCEVSRPMMPTLIWGSAARQNEERDMRNVRARASGNVSFMGVDEDLTGGGGHSPPYGESSFRRLMARSASSSPPPGATRLLTISYEPSAKALVVGT